MTNKNLHFEPNAEIQWEHDVKAVRVLWKKLYMDLEKFQEICVAAFEVLQNNSGTIWIADQYNSEGAFKPEIQNFIVNELADIAKKNGLSMVLTILPKNPGLSSMSAKKWSKEVKQRGEFINEQFATLGECKEWIETVNKS